MYRLIAALLFSALPLAATAQDTRLRPLDRADEAKEWWAVGRVNIGNDGYCTGTLIEVNVVLTAAHCFFDPYSGRRVPDSAIRFVAGFKDGSAQSIRGAKKVVVDPGYDPRAPITLENTAHDVALFELDQPILDSVIAPIRTGGSVRPGDEVSIVSYGRGRSNRPSIQDVCRVRDRTGTVLELNCDVTFGSSGAAVMDLSGREPRIVSVISSGINVPGYREINSPELTEALARLKPLLSIGVQERKSLRAGEGGLAEVNSGFGETPESLPTVTSGLPNTAGDGLGDTRSGLQPVRSGLPNTRKGLPQIGE